MSENSGFFLQGSEEEEIREQRQKEGAPISDADDALGLSELRKYHILPLHSQLIPEDQHQVFDPAPPERRKIILSTNIAETSVTIDDIVYVINSGIAKEMIYDQSRATGVLENQMISKANNTQRKGRAGRCQEGTAIHLFSRYWNNTLKSYQCPEILANSLEENILQAMCLNLGTDPYYFFQRTVSVPPADRVESGVEILLNIGALEMVCGADGNPSPALTDLGRWLGTVPQHPCGTLTMTYASLFGVLMPTLACLSFLGQKSPFDIKDGDKGGNVGEETGRRGIEVYLTCH